MSNAAYVQAEERRAAASLVEIEKWINSERFQYTTRPYTAQDVLNLRGTLNIPVRESGVVATKLYKMLRSAFNEGMYHHTFGALDTVQVVQMAKVCGFLVFLFSFLLPTFLVLDLCVRQWMAIFLHGFHLQ